MPKSEKNPILILAHGAGAGAESAFMKDISRAISAYDISVSRFNFPYMEWSIKNGKPRPPSPIHELVANFKQQIEAVSDSEVWIGGKSLGGRVAAMLNNHRKVAGVIVYGYPFHPVGRPDKLRLDPLKSPSTNITIIQGERDRFGNRKEVSQYRLDKKVKIEWIPSGDHSFAALKRSSVTYEDNINLAADITQKVITNS